MSAGNFFGASLDAVRDSRQRRDYCAETERQLEEQLRQLRSRRDRLTSTSGNQVQQQTEKIQQTEQRLEQAQKSLGELLKKYQWLARIDASFWVKLGLRMARLFWRKTLPVGEIKGRMATLERELEDAEADVDYWSLVRVKQQRALQRQTEPIEELDHVIKSLEGQLDQAGRERADCDKEILDAVRRVVRLTSADGLRVKLTGFGPQTNMASLIRLVYRLRALMLQLDLIDMGEEGELAAAEPQQAEKRIGTSVDDAFRRQTSHGISQMRMSGQGTTHVRKTRTRMETVRDSDGNMRTQPRTEHYWDTSPVTFEGELPVSFEIVYRRWDPAAVASALRDEATTSFALGVQQFRKTHAQRTEDSLIRQADACTREIRDILLRELD
jgi:hypothetical protein